MIKFFKFIVFIVVLGLVGLFGAFYYVNSNSFTRLLEARLSEELGNTISMASFKLHADGDVTLKGVKVLALDDSLLLSMARIEVEVQWRDLLTQDYLPQNVKLFDVDLDFSVKDNSWPLAILNKEKKLPPSPNFFAKVKALNLHLNKRSALLKKYAVDLDLLSAEVENVPVISSFRAKGVVSERMVKLDLVNFGMFSGSVESVISVLLSHKHEVQEATADFKLSNLECSDIGDFAKLTPFQVLGRISGDLNAVFGIDGLNVNADLTTGSLAMNGPGVEQALNFLKIGEKTLSFTSSRVKFKATEQELLFSKLELLNRRFISLYAPRTKIALDVKYQPHHITLPLRLSAPYDVLKWRDFAKENDPNTIEIPFDLDCDVKDLKTELMNALIYTIQKHSLKKSIKRLEDKLGFKVDDQVIDVKKVLDHKVYKDIKESVKKEVDRIDRKQVDNLIDTFEKDDKKKKKLKKHIDLFMQFLQ